MDSLTDYVIDTVALVKYLEDDLPRAADAIFRGAEDGRNQLFLPEIALGELAYIALRGRLRNVEPAAAVSTVISQVLDSGFIEPSCLRRTGWDRFLWLPIPQLHHRMIAADAVDRRCALVSNDPAFGSVGDLKLVWR
ncbi:MAG TPA: hypothetical protein VJ400_08520 [Thermoplasmata archaeon]|nr:hypothetical protein [Thermoplasmata archaeon]